MCIERTELIGQRCLVTVRCIPAHVINDMAGHHRRHGLKDFHVSAAYEFNNYVPSEEREYEATIVKAAQQTPDKPVWLQLKAHGLSVPSDIWAVPWRLDEVTLVDEANA